MEIMQRRNVYVTLTEEPCENISYLYLPSFRNYSLHYNFFLWYIIICTLRILWFVGKINGHNNLTN